MSTANHSIMASEIDMLIGELEAIKGRAECLDKHTGGKRASFVAYLSNLLLAEFGAWRSQIHQPSQRCLH